MPLKFRSVLNLNKIKIKIEIPTLIYRLDDHSTSVQNSLCQRFFTDHLLAFSRKEVLSGPLPPIAYQNPEEPANLFWLKAASPLQSHPKHLA
jgi:hypothetical protein